MFKTVCLGGTFDGIHVGHQLLFGEAAKLCQERLVVGVTDGNMLKSKFLWELIAPVDERIRKVRDYLHGVNPNLTYHIVPITDLYGPTTTIRDIDCIVVSEETVRGAAKINEVRVAKGWPELKTHVVNLIKDKTTDSELLARLKENKVSSSSTRVQKLGTIIKEPEPNPSIPDEPYLIGLTGGVASGKTAVGKFLESLGFGYINYDIMGHKTYEKVGSPVYNQIVDRFGRLILNETTNAIERSRLGQIVFADKSKLEELNQIVWPAIYELVDQEIERLKVDHDVIALESALLIESQQTKRVHQIWTCLISPEEAVRRQVETRGLSKEEAEKRVNSQTDNSTRVRNSNAIFYTAWEPEVTQQQVLKCVNELKTKFLKR